MTRNFAQEGRLRTRKVRLGLIIGQSKKEHLQRGLEGELSQAMWQRSVTITLVSLHDNDLHTGIQASSISCLC